MLTPEIIEAARADLARTISDLAVVTEGEIAHKQALDEARAEAITQGLIVGKNQAERDAAEYQLLRHPLDDLAETQAVTREARTLFDIATLNWHAIGYELRLLECTQDVST
jgi:hypothetical protein